MRGRRCPHLHVELGQRDGIGQEEQLRVVAQGVWALRQSLADSTVPAQLLTGEYFMRARDSAQTMALTRG